MSIKKNLRDEPQPAITLGEVFEKEKRRNRKPVYIGDNANTIIFVDKDKDPDVARKEFAEKLDKFNPIAVERHAENIKKISNSEVSMDKTEINANVSQDRDIDQEEIESLDEEG